MKKTLLLITFVLGFSGAAFADACGSTGDKLSDYIALGTCTLSGTDLVFSAFSYTDSGSSIPIPDTDVTVVPTIAGDEAGFEFKAPWLAPTGQTLDADIEYTVSCTGCDIDDWVLSMGGVALPTGTDASASVGETSIQVGGTGLAVGYSTTGSTPSDSQTIVPPLSTFSVDKDLTVYGGTTAGTSGIVAKVSTITNLFSGSPTTVPEPSLAILCVGILGLVPFAKRRFVR
jgi:hypothetical protein